MRVQDPAANVTVATQAPAASNGPGDSHTRMPPLRAILDHRLARHFPLVVVVLAFVVSRAIFFWVCGIRFDETGIEFACQLLDTHLLRTDLLRNVYYLHHQVPLWNLEIGVVLKLFPVHHAEAFATLQCLLGFGLALSILSILRSLGVGPVVRTLATIVFCISPAVVTYEWWISYHYLGAPLLAMGLAMLGRFLRTRSRVAGHLCFALLALVVLSRSVFGVSWMGAIIAILLLFRPVPRLLTLRVAVIPLLLISFTVVKTKVQTGRSLGHALLAPNLVHKILQAMPSRTREKLFADGKISRLSRYYPFADLRGDPEFHRDLPKTGIPGLDQEFKVNGLPNANALQHVYLGDIYMKDAKWLLTHFPRVYAASVWSAMTGEYMNPAADVEFVPGLQPYRAVGAMHALWAKVFYLEHNGRYWGLTFGLPLSLFFGILWLVGPKAILPSYRSRTPMIAMMVLTILNTLATTFLSLGDFNRYRFDADAFFFILFVLLVGAIWNWTRAFVTGLRSFVVQGVDAQPAH